jgi:hypothetical protein
MVHELEILGDPEEPCKVAAKYLCIVPKRFVPVAVLIELVLDNKVLNKLQGLFIAASHRKALTRRVQVGSGV